MDASILISLIIAGVVLAVIAVCFLERHLPVEQVVREGTDYPNNHHVLGVGYYHAAGRCWHVFPWNEFRDGQGYYWDGEWHTVPDQRQVLTSVPEPEEIERVNRAWRSAGPSASAQFWSDVDRFGFGTAIGRRHGS